MLISPGSKIKIWYLNRTDDLLRNQKEDFLEIFRNRGLLSSGKKFSAETGKRRVVDPRNGKSVETTQLMPSLSVENIEFDEYFVPIAAKCLGDKLENPGFKAGNVNGPPLLEGIKNDLKQRLPGGIDGFWSIDESLRTHNNAAMLTEGRKGYYSLLTEDPDAFHILIGYSQGGLVARFLAFLDDHVFESNRIIGVITISSPNYGSPLANPLNRSTVGNGLLETVGSLLSISDSFTNFYNPARNNELIQWILESMGALLTDIKRQPVLNKEMLNTFATAYKWLGGLAGSKDSAFYDLDLNRMRDTSSVLTLVNSKPLRQCFYASIISGNYNVQQILNGVFTGLMKGFVLGRIEDAQVFGKKIGDNMGASTAAYRDKVMKEFLENPSPEAREVKNEHDQNPPTPIVAQGDAILSNAHDFIVPSVYQLMRPPQPGRYFLGNFANPAASHLSGADPLSQGGEINIKLVRMILKQIFEKLS